MDVVRILLANSDESDAGEYPSFYITPSEYAMAKGVEVAAKRCTTYSNAPHRSTAQSSHGGERIEVPETAIVEVSSVLQPKTLSSLRTTRMTGTQITDRKQRCKRHQSDVILTNPQFAGQGGSRIPDPRLLVHFDTARRLTVNGDSSEATDDHVSSQSPWVLFFERALAAQALRTSRNRFTPRGFLDTLQFLPPANFYFGKPALTLVIAALT